MYKPPPDNRPPAQTLRLTLVWIAAMSFCALVVWLTRTLQIDAIS